MVEWSLNTVANVSTAVAVVIALVFGYIQVRQQERKRRDVALSDALQAAQSQHVAGAIHDLLYLAPGKESLQTLGPDLRRSLFIVENVLDTVGHMVYRRVIDLHELDLIWGGQLRAVWRNVAPFAEEMRRAGRPSAFEWTQWLVERMDQHPTPGKLAGAHVAQAGWRP